VYYRLKKGEVTLMVMRISAVLVVSAEEKRTRTQGGKRKEEKQRNRRKKEGTKEKRGTHKGERVGAVTKHSTYSPVVLRNALA
jgi:hypothetical protein